MERLVFENQFGALFRRQPVLHECQVTIFVVTIKLVADDGVAEVRQVDPDLMFAAGAGNKAEQGEWWINVVDGRVLEFTL